MFSKLTCLLMITRHKNFKCGSRNPKSLKGTIMELGHTASNTAAQVCVTLKI